MGDDKKMSLQMAIMANGSAALKTLKQVTAEVNRFGDACKQTGSVGGAAFSVIGKVGGAVLAPLRWAATAATALTAGLTALGGAALKAASDDEDLIDRLAMVYDGYEQGKKVFTELEALSRRSPFKTDDLAEATIILKQFGMDGEKNLGAVAAAARVSGHSVAEMALAISAMQVRGLKRFGIGIDEKQGAYIVSWKDSFGKLHREVKATREEASKLLIGIFGQKFGVSFAPRTFSQFTAMLKNNIDQVFATFGEKLLGPATAFVNRIALGLTALIESGKLEKWGAAAADWLIKAAAAIQTAFQMAADIWKGLAEKGNFAAALREIFLACAATLAVAFANYLVAMKDVFVGVGKMLAVPFIEELMKVPFLRGVIMKKFAERPDAPAELKKFAHFGFSTPGGWESGEKAVKGMLAKDPDMLIRSGLSNITKAGRMLGETGGAVENIWRGTGANLGNLSGYSGESFRKQYGENKQRIEVEIKLLNDAKEKIKVEGVRTVGNPATNAGGT